MMALRLRAPACAAIVAFALAACGSDLAGSLSAASVTGYGASNALAPTGHSVAELGENRVRVTATGSAVTPKSRVEKIALARAAEYGGESGYKFFQAGMPQHAIRCGKTKAMERGATVKLPSRGYVVVELDVTYAKDQIDPTYRPTKSTAETLLAEIAADPGAPDAEAKAAVDAQCGA